jgi:DNA-binding NtrC family response regulator
VKILIVEDDEALRPTLVKALARRGRAVDSAATGSAALEKLGEIDLLVTDIRLPDMEGIELLTEARRRRPGIDVIVMTAYGTIPSAVEAMRAGARAYLTKPFDTEELLIHIMQWENAMHLRTAAAFAGRGELVGVTPPMLEVYDEIDTAAASSAPVLIRGETGTGKELAARAIHALSSRASAPFIPVNLGAIPRDLAEAELFGFEKGAFTGAHARKVGRFALAHQGTLLLDEVDSFPLDLQAKLLRAIELGEVWMLGSSKPDKHDVRIIATTNLPPETLVAEGRFREDLFFRLNVISVQLPPLRKRYEDIPLLTRKLLDRIAPAGTRVDISREALSQLFLRDWPGNVRELANTLERALAQKRAAGVGNSVLLDVGDLQNAASTTGSLPFRKAKGRIADEWAKRTIFAALNRSRGNITDAARQLEMSRFSLQRLMKRYGIATDM